MTRWLITGAGGQLATAFAELLCRAQNGDAVVLMHENDTDLRNTSAVQDAVRAAAPDIVLHTAAYTAVDAAEHDEATALAVNEGGTQNLAAALAQLPDAGMRPALLVSFSTDYVFDGQKQTPYVESDIPNPVNAYGRSKLAQELATLSWPGGIVVRTAWLYSPIGTNFVRTILRLARERMNGPDGQPGDHARTGCRETRPTPLRVVNDQTGSPTYAPHLARAVLELLATRPEPGIYHLAGSGACTWLDLAHEVIRQAGLPVDVVPMTTAELGRPAPRPTYSVLASERPVPSLPGWHEGVAACLEALAAREPDPTEEAL